MIDNQILDTNKKQVARKPIPWWLLGIIGGAGSIVFLIAYIYFIKPITYHYFAPIPIILSQIIVALTVSKRYWWYTLGCGFIGAIVFLSVFATYLYKIITSNIVPTWYVWEILMNEGGIFLLHLAIATAIIIVVSALWRRYHKKQRESLMMF